MTVPAPSNVSGQTTSQIKRIAIKETSEPVTKAETEIVPTTETKTNEKTQTTQLSEEIPPSGDESSSVWPRRMADIHRVKPGSYRFASMVFLHTR